MPPYIEYYCSAKISVSKILEASQCLSEFQAWIALMLILQHCYALDII
jgi:hypothetical protein